MNSWITATLGSVFGLLLLVVGGELLVRGASRLASVMRVSRLVIGLTVVAYGTSSPELAVSIQSSLSGQADIALGNVVGSNIFNVLFILGISALIMPLVVSSRLIRWDVPLMVAVSVCLLALGYDGVISRLDGICLVTGLAAYTYWCIRESRKETAATPHDDVGLPGNTGPVASHGRLIASQIAFIVVGLALLGIGSQLLVGGSTFVARQLGVSELVIGLTIVSAGTSLPEVVTSLTAALRGERDIAVGNVVGSNIFNILGVLGLASVVSSDGVAVASVAYRVDIPVMVATAIACLPILFTGNLIARWEGGVLFGYYVAYTAYLILTVTHADVSRTFGVIMAAFVLPLTTITLAVCFVRSVKSPSRAKQTT